jgi:hypothetical protein
VFLSDESLRLQAGAVLVGGEKGQAKATPKV